ncbi:MAG: M18 family aminopeptidase, partial [Muribaculaceae bacterium]|nr:M18 family aminopeptidase [Muribaculaceae bacterium]
MNLHQFLDASTCNFLAVDAITSQLREAGFTELREADKWNVKPGDKHYVVKNGSAVMAFVAGSDPAAGFAVIAAHSDAPGFRLKPAPVM